jgi:hypothetical protein
LGNCLYFGLLIEITEVAQSLAYFLHGESYSLIVAKNRLGHTLGDTFTKASGHPGGRFRSILGAEFFLKMFLISFCIFSVYFTTIIKLTMQNM